MKKTNNSIEPTEMSETMMQVYNDLSLAIGNVKGVTINYAVHKPCKNMGFISMIGNNVFFADPQLLLVFAQTANNIEVLPRTDSKIEINLMFYKN